MRRRSAGSALAFAAAVLVAACAGQVGAAPSSSDAHEPTAAGSQAVESAAQESASASLAAPSTSPTSWDEATQTPSAAKPTAEPVPTPDWDEVGYTVGIRDPVALGGKARVELDAPVGPTCTLSAKYPNGKAASVGSPSHPKAGEWVWLWTVPTGAGLGKATVSFSCTYAGVAKPGTDSFQLVTEVPPPTPTPTKAPSWSISGSVDGPVSGSNGTLTFTGHVNGTPPPGIAPIDLYCRFYVTVNGFESLIDSEGSVQTRDFTLAGPVGYTGPGTFHWHVTCDATAEPRTRQVAGTFQAT